MVIPRSLFGMLLMGTAAPLAIASAVRSTKVILVPRQQATTDQPTATGFDWNEYLECSSLMEEVGEKLMPSPPPEIPLFWYAHSVVQEMMETMEKGDGERPRTTGTAFIAEQCSMEAWRDTKLVPNEKEDGKELVQKYKSWIEHTKEIKSKYKSSVFSLATRCAYMSTLPGDVNVEWQAGALMSAVALNEQECASALSVMAGLTTVDGGATFGGAAATTIPTAGSNSDTAAASASTGGAWKGRETGAAVAVVAGIVGAVVGL